MGHGQSLTGVTSASNPSYNLNTRAVEYLAKLNHEEHPNVFALRTVTENGVDAYHHDFDSDDYVSTVTLYEEGKSPDTVCIYYVPWVDSNYCVFYTIEDECDTICVIDLANPDRVADISGGDARSLPIEDLIELAQRVLSADSVGNTGSEDDNANAKGTVSAEGIECAECTECEESFGGLTKFDARYEEGTKSKECTECEGGTEGAEGTGRTTDYDSKLS